jgi:hypothetical protein
MKLKAIKEHDLLIISAKPLFIPEVEGNEMEKFLKKSVQDGAIIAYTRGTLIKKGKDSCENFKTLLISEMSFEELNFQDEEVFYYTIGSFLPSYR